MLILVNEKNIWKYWVRENVVIQGLYLEDINFLCEIYMLDIINIKKFVLKNKKVD